MEDCVNGVFIFFGDKIIHLYWLFDEGMSVMDMGIGDDYRDGD